MIKPTQSDSRRAQTISFALLVCLCITVFCSASLAEPLIPNIPTTGTIVSGGDVDTYEIAISANQSYFVLLSHPLPPADSYCATIALFDPAGSFLGANSCQGGRIVGRAELSGIYTLEVSDPPGIIGDSGPYSLLLGLFPGIATDGEIPNGGSVTSSITNGDMDIYSFHVNQGDFVTLSSSHVGDLFFGHFFDVYAPSGEFVARAELVNGSIVAVAGFIAQETGTYTLVVADSLNVASSSYVGDYLVHLARVPSVPEGSQISAGQTVEGTITRADLDLYSFFAAQGEEFELSLNWPDSQTYSSVLVLYGPSGNQLSFIFSSAEGEGIPIVWTATESGYYNLVVSDNTNFPPDEGPYILSYEKTIDLCGDGFDLDTDGVPDVCDNCLFINNPDQLDSDGDGYGNICDPDLNNDCMTNFEDLGALKAVFFSADDVADFNGDGSVNFFDLGIMRERFFAVPGPSGINSTCDGGR